MGRKNNPKGANQRPQLPPTWKLAEARAENGPLFKLMQCARIYCDDDYPMAKEDWAYVTSDADIYLNQKKTASVGEWEYVISHCLLHLRFDHILQVRVDDLIWNTLCDYVVDKLL